MNGVSDDPRQSVRIPPPPAETAAEATQAFAGPAEAATPPMGDLQNLGVVADHTAPAQEAQHLLEERYGATSPDQADVIVVLGGDGFMLHTIHRFMARSVPLYGMNRGTVGFLMNEYSEDDLLERLGSAVPHVLRPLRMVARSEDGSATDALAVNEVSLLRQSRQAAKIRISIDGVVRMDELVSDGVLVATAAGSTAYNLSAHGPIIPLDARLLALTPVSAFRPRRWRGALLPAAAEVHFEILEGWKRPVSAVADETEVRNVVDVQVRQDPSTEVTLLCDAAHNLEERIIREQFGV